MATSADRQKRLRRRRARGLQSLTIDVPDVWPDTLISGGYLSPGQAEDRDAIRKATERFIATTRISVLREKP